MYKTRHLVLFYISSKYHRNFPKDIPLTERTRNLFQIKQRVITPKVRKAELSFLYATSRLVLFYISTKYHQNIPNGIQVTEWTRSFTPMLTPMGSVPKTICPPTVWKGAGGGEGGGDMTSLPVCIPQKFVLQVKNLKIPKKCYVFAYKSVVICPAKMSAV